ncbi:MAG: putative two-component regulator sensor histidine kinase protein [Phenylobacterium sp.]|nr:putative two-component regulator sensor histidine kinase protein [Phenylobacterium sp.]
MSEAMPAPQRTVPAEDLEDLYQNAPCGYLSMFPDGQIFRVNATLAGWTGRTPEDLTGARFRDLLTIPSRIVYEAQLAPLVQTDTSFDEVVLDLQTTSGEKAPVLISGVRRRDAVSGEVFSRLTLMRVSDRRRYERELLASRDAAEAEAEISHEREADAIRLLADARDAAALREQFIAVLGHDLRNPLASVSGAARLLRKQPQTDKALVFIDLLETSTDRMAALIEDVLDLARGRLGGGLPLNRSRSSLEPVLGQVVAELRTSHPDRVIVADFALTQPLNLDAGRIGQLASNLLGNAITHGDPGVPIRIGSAVSEGVFELWVANGGAPIPHKAMERLFQPFFRGEVRASQQGLGLGLYICSEIAKAHGGELTVSSTAEETRFTFRVPVDEHQVSTKAFSSTKSPGEASEPSS